MKNKFLLFVAVLLATSATSFAQTQMVTFQVTSPDSLPVYVFGSWSGWSNFPGDVMTQVAPNKYSVTLSIASNTTHEYQFVNGTQAEALNPTSACTNMNTQYTNRVLQVNSVDTAVCYTWETCTTCTVTPPPPPPTPINVTFQVTSPDSLPVSVIGSWNWGAAPTTMTSVGANTYEATIPLTNSTNYEFLYTNGTSFVNEALDPTWPCTNMNTQYTNRTLNVGTADTTICFVWDSCTTCTGPPPPAPVMVTFQVQNPDSLPVFVFGSWTGWSNFPGDTMVSVGNGVYERTLPIQANGTIEYLFVSGTKTESMDSTAPCTNMNPQYTNRMTAIGGSDTTLCAQWESCALCVPVGVDEITKDNLSIFVGTKFINLKATELTQVDGIEIFNMVGKSIYSSNGKVLTNQRIPVNLQSNTLYLIRVNNGNQYHTVKTIIAE